MAFLLITTFSIMNMIVSVWNSASLPAHMFSVFHCASLVTGSYGKKLCRVCALCFEVIVDSTLEAALDQKLQAMRDQATQAQLKVAFLRSIKPGWRT